MTFMARCHEPGHSLGWLYSEMLVELFVEPGLTLPGRKCAWLCTTPFRVELRMDCWQAWHMHSEQERHI